MRVCVVVVEAVEAVVQNLLPETVVGGDYYPATDWNRNSYAAFGAAQQAEI
jgi:hypothetical protein